MTADLFATILLALYEVDPAERVTKTNQAVAALVLLKERLEQTERERDVFKARANVPRTWRDRASRAEAELASVRASEERLRAQVECFYDHAEIGCVLCGEMPATFASITTCLEDDCPLAALAAAAPEEAGKA